MVEFKNSGIRSNALDGIFRKTELSRQKCLDIGVFCQGMSPDDSITAPSEKGLLHRWSGLGSENFGPFDSVRPPFWTWLRFGDFTKLN